LGLEEVELAVEKIISRNSSGSNHQVNESELRDKLNQILINLNEGRDGVRGAGGGADGGGGGAGGADNEESLENLMVRVTAVLTARTNEFMRIQNDQDAARAQAAEAEAELADARAQVAEAKAARAKAEEQARAPLDAAAQEVEAERSKAAADAARAKAAEAAARAAEAQAARARANRNRLNQALRNNQRARGIPSEAPPSAQVGRGGIPRAHSRQDSEDEGRQGRRVRTRRRLRINNPDRDQHEREQRELEERLRRLKEMGKDDTDDTRKLKQQIKSHLYSINELRDVIRSDDEKIRKLLEDFKKAEEEAKEGEDKNEVLRRHNKALQDYVEYLKTKGLEIPKDPAGPLDPEAPPAPSPGVPPAPAPSPAGPPVPGSDPDPDQVPVPVAKETVEISEYEKKRNGLYLRINYNEAKIPDDKIKTDDRSNLFFVITDDINQAREIDNTRRYDSYELSSKAIFFHALNNQIDFSSGNGVRICFMKSNLKIQVGECDITEQNFIDINDQIAKTRIFIDDNGRKKIEDYRIRLEEEFREFLRVHKDQECDPNLREKHLSAIHSLKGLDDLNKLKTQMSTWGRGLTTGNKVKVFDDDFNDDKIAKKAKELADKCLANRFKSGIIGVEEETVRSLPATAAAAGAPAPAKEYEDVAIGFIKIVRSQKSNQPVKVFVGETAGPTTANIWDENTKSYIQVSLETEPVDGKSIIKKIKEVQQITQDGDKIDPPASLLKIDFFIERRGDRSGLFAPVVSTDPTLAKPEDFQMLHKTEIRGGSVKKGGEDYYFTNGFAHQKDNLNPLTYDYQAIGKIQATDLKDNEINRNIKVVKDVNGDSSINIDSERHDNFKLSDRPLISEFMNKKIPQYVDGGKHVKGVVLRSGGQLTEANITMEQEFSDRVLRSVCVCATPSKNTPASTRTSSTQISKTSAPIPSPNDPSANAAQAQKPSCFGILSGG